MLISEKSAKLEYRQDIDGLRAIAVLGVIIYHAKLYFDDNRVLPGGYLGVDIFFVISGYLIGGIVLKELEAKTFKFFDFFERRIRRIVPILIVVIYASLPLAWAYSLPNDFLNYARQINASLAFISNFYFWLMDPYWAEDGISRPFLHTWSLSIEEQFYILAPFLLIFLSRAPKMIAYCVLAFVVASSLLIAQFASASFADFGFYLLPSRAWELAIGIAVAYATYRQQKIEENWVSELLSITALFAIFTSMSVFDQNTRHPSILTLIPVTSTAILIWACPSAPFLKRFLTKQPLVNLGLLSFSLYLWHYPLFTFVKPLISGYGSSFATGATILCTLFLSYFSYQLIEQPFRSRAKVSKRSLLTILIVAIFPIAVIGIGAEENGFKNRFPQIINAPIRQNAIENHTWSDFGSSLNGSLLIVGDSHMREVAPQIKALAKELGFRFASSTYGGCQFLLGADRVNKKTLQPHSFCNRSFQDKRLDFISTAPPSYVVMGGRLPMIIEEDRFNNNEGGDEGEFYDMIQNEERSLTTKGQRKNFIKKQFQETVAAILGAGHVVILIYPIPEVGWHVPKEILRIVGHNYSMAEELMKQNPITTSYSVFKKRTLSSYQVLNSIDSERIIRVYPEKLFCDNLYKGRCQTHDNENSFYIDDDHLSVAGGQMLAEIVKRSILEFQDADVGKTFTKKQTH